MRTACIHIKRAFPHAFRHNSRQITPDYVIDDASKNECNRNEKEAYRKYYELFATAMKNYFDRTQQEMQLSMEKSLWEAVIVLESKHTMEDIKKLSQKLNTKYGWQEIQIAIHRDEGHIHKETGQTHYNYHAHIVFLMVSPDGIYRFKRREFDRKKMAELQKFVAEELKMKRGTPVKETKRVRLEHAEYRQMQEIMQDLKNELERMKQEANMFEEAMEYQISEKMIVQDQYCDMSDEMSIVVEKSKKKDKKIKELERSIEQLKNQNKEKMYQKLQGREC